MGVWIETEHLDAFLNLVLSHPAWVCGLKPFVMVHPMKWQKSHPAWVCGLKRWVTRLENNNNVTPCVGVCIETPVSWLNFTTSIVTPCVGVWIETLINDKKGTNLSHTLRGCVD